MDEAGQGLLVSIVMVEAGRKAKVRRVNQGAVPRLLILDVASTQRVVHIYMPAMPFSNIAPLQRAVVR